MIKNQWYLVLDAKEVKKNKLVGVTRLSEKLVFWRDENNEVNCIFDKCCHRGASLSAGKVVGNHVQCPFHGFLYDSKGRVINIPANGKQTLIPENFKVNSYIVKEAYGFIWLWYSEDKDNIPEIPFFEDLKNGFTYGGFSESWPVHYTRAIENQLDVVHLPFVHKTTIGADNRTLVNGPVVKWKDNLMTFYVNNDRDNGAIPLKPDEIKDYEKLFSLQFQMPNIWQNRISDQVRIFAGFAPIDDGNTRIYLRFYQSFMKVPILKELINSSSNIFNRIILHQDRKVVLTQLPIKSEFKINENLIQGDLPIIEFRKKRDQLR
ncbi:MAG: aromatic ring-hydroxylating dioxygenase subunit alpha [Firmicutes bacterium]|nr:aromatic ring-hydroxylating dioxygenase subunit alpha [Bacillota bacterium]